MFENQSPKFVIFQAKKEKLKSPYLDLGCILLVYSRVTKTFYFLPDLFLLCIIASKPTSQNWKKRKNLCSSHEYWRAIKENSKEVLVNLFSILLKKPWKHPITKKEEIQIFGPFWIQILKRKMCWSNEKIF